MENKISQHPYLIIAFIASFLLCLVLEFFWRRTNTRLAIKDIHRRLKGRARFEGIVEIFKHLPVRKIWGEQYQIDDYIKTIITDAISLKECFFHIEVIVSNRKKKEALTELVLDSIKRKFSIEDLARIYADCLLKNALQRNGLVHNLFPEEKALILSIIADNHLNEDATQREESFRSQVIKTLDGALASKTEEERILIRAEIIKFRCLKLPGKGDTGLRS